MQANRLNVHRLSRISLIGFGEAGGILGADLAKQGCSVTTFDILLSDTRTRDAMLAKAKACHVRPASSLADAVRDAELVISAVTANAAEAVATAAAKAMTAGQVFLDINSIAPETKQRNARVLEAVSLRYVEAAVMAPVPPQRLRVPMLLGGAHADVLAEQLVALGMNAKAVSDRIGVASAIKMCRSIMIKGLEALTVECMFTARRYGAEDAVLASLHASFPSLGWNGEFPDYLISRVAEHGRRRAAEMREVARTIEDVGLKSLMASATADRQEALVDAMQAAGVAYDAEPAFSWRELADKLART